jgi:hypothetical protein
MGRFVPCTGSNQRALNRFADVGSCRACGVRTFVNHDGIIQPHKASN